MAIGARLDINTPKMRSRSRSTLLSVAEVLPTDRDGVDRLGAGVEWLPWPSIEPTHEEADCDTTYSKTVRSLPALAEQEPFLVWDRFECSTAGPPLSWLAEITARGIDDEGFLSAQIAMELESGTHSGALDLTGEADVVAASAVGLDVALARLEDYLASASGAGRPGMLGVIHLTPALLTIAVGDGLVEADSMGVWRTPTGHAVIGDAGHTGQVAPAAGSAPGDDEAWIYATGEVWYAVSSLKGVTRSDDGDGGAVYVIKNKNQPLVERYGIVLFDPNTVAAALVTIAASDGGGSGGGGDATAANQATGNASLANIESGQAEATLTRTPIAAGAIAGVTTVHGWGLYNSHASDAVLIYVRDGSDAADPVVAPIAIAAGQSVNVFAGKRVFDGIPITGGNGIHITDESSGTATIADLVGNIQTGA